MSASSPAWRMIYRAHSAFSALASIVYTCTLVLDEDENKALAFVQMRSHP